MSSSTHGGPLAGFRIIDFSANMTGPYATMVLAEQGADVIKIEPIGGEVVRRIGTGRGGVSAYFANLNHSKRSLAIDLRHPDASELASRLIETADVVIQNFRPGVMESMGLGPDAICERFPRVVYASISGFGRVGPLASAPAYDHVVQALSGMAARNSDGRGGPPSLVRHGVVDKVTGLFAAQAITAALLQRSKSGKGGRIEITMLNAALHFLWPDGMMNDTCLDEVNVLPSIAGGFRLSETADGYVALITVTDAQWTGLISAVGLDDVLQDPDFQTMDGRLRNGGRVMKRVGELLKQLPTSEVLRRTAAHDVPCMPVVELDKVRSQEQVVAYGALEESDHPVLGRIVQPRHPSRYLDVEDVDRHASASVGENADEVLAEIGMGPGEIAKLRGTGILG